MPDAQSLLETLARVKVASAILQDFVPLRDSLDWRLGQEAWRRDGDSGFLRNSIPYLVNNSGRLSERAAELLHAALEAARPQGQIALLEVGAGTGLFASMLLGCFARLCERKGTDYSGRVTLHVTDASERTVEAWHARGQFDPWGATVRAAVLDVTAEAGLPDSFFAVFANYVLDVMPARVVRNGEGGPEELCLRVHGNDGPIDIDGPQIAERLHRTVLEAAFRPCDPALPWLFEALETAAAGAATILNDTAIDLLLRLSGRLSPGGLILVNDYGTATVDAASPPVPQRFGDTVAIGVNFPLLGAILNGRGLEAAAPDGDGERPIHTRLISVGPPDAGVLAMFSRAFSAQADRAADGPASQARKHAAAGRRSEALEALRRAMQIGSNDWQLLGWAAEFVGLDVGDHGAGFELAQAALALNPWTSPWLWNVLGDCLFMASRPGEAEAAYLRALAVSADDPRGNLNLAYTRMLAGRPDEALSAIARGLAGDVSGEWRTRLVDKQAEILGRRAAELAERQTAWQQRASVLAAAVNTGSTSAN